MNKSPQNKNKILPIQDIQIPTRMSNDEIKQDRVSVDTLNTPIPEKNGLETSIKLDNSQQQFTQRRNNFNLSFIRQQQQNKRQQSNGGSQECLPVPTRYNLDTSYQSQHGTKNQIKTRKPSMIYNSIIQNNQRQNKRQNTQTEFESYKLGDILFKIKIKQNLRNFLQNLTSWKSKRLQQMHYYLINDRGSHIQDSKQQQQQKQTNKYLLDIFDDDYDNEEEIQKKSKNTTWGKVQYFIEKSLLFKILQKLFQKLPVFQPASHFRMALELFHITMIFVLIFYIPLIVCFEKPLYYFISETLITLGRIFILLDFLVCLNTGYYDKGVQILNRYLIFKNWIQTSVLTDIISTIPFFILGSSEYSHYQYGQLLFLFKLRRVNFLFRKIEDMFPLQKQKHNILALVQLFYVIVITSHIFSVIWIWIGQQQEQSGDFNNWMRAEEITEKEWDQIYLVSYYFIMVTMITVGYGDIGPISEIELVLCIITMLLSCGVFAYALNQIDIIFREMYEFESNIRENMTIINNYMNSKNVSKDLQFQIRQYLDYVWREFNQDSLQEDHIVGQLSDILREKLLLEANKIVLKDSAVFKNNFSESLIQKTVPFIKEYKCTPQEEIYIENQKDENSIFFIEKGTVEVYLKPQNENELQKFQTLQILSTGDSFGIYSFFTGKSQKINIRSMQFSTLLMIKRNDFLELLQDYQDDYEKFCNIRDLIDINMDFRKLNVKCDSCSSHNHFMTECPIVHYNPNKILVITKDTYYTPHKDRKEHRRRKYKFNVVKDNERAIQLMYEFHQTREQDLDNYEQKNQLNLEDKNDKYYEDLSSDDISDNLYEDEDDSNTSVNSTDSIITIQEEDDDDEDLDSSQSNQKSKKLNIQKLKKSQRSMRSQRSMVRTNSKSKHKKSQSSTSQSSSSSSSSSYSVDIGVSQSSKKTGSSSLGIQEEESEKIEESISLKMNIQDLYTKSQKKQPSINIIQDNDDSHTEKEKQNQNLKKYTDDDIFVQEMTNVEKKKQSLPNISQHLYDKSNSITPNQTSRREKRKSETVLTNNSKKKSITPIRAGKKATFTPINQTPDTRRQSNKLSISVLKALDEQRIKNNIILDQVSPKKAQGQKYSSRSISDYVSSQESPTTGNKIRKITDYFFYNEALIKRQQQYLKNQEQKSKEQQQKEQEKQENEDIQQENSIELLEFNDQIIQPQIQLVKSASQNTNQQITPRMKQAQIRKLNSNLVSSVSQHDDIICFDNQMDSSSKKNQFELFENDKTKKSPGIKVTSYDNWQANQNLRQQQSSPDSFGKNEYNQENIRQHNSLLTKKTLEALSQKFNQKKKQENLVNIKSPPTNNSQNKNKVRISNYNQIITKFYSNLKNYERKPSEEEDQQKFTDLQNQKKNSKKQVSLKTPFRQSTYRSLEKSQDMQSKDSLDQPFSKRDSFSELVNSNQTGKQSIILQTPIRTKPNVAFPKELKSNLKKPLAKDNFMNASSRVMTAFNKIQSKKEQKQQFQQLNPMNQMNPMLMSQVKRSSSKRDSLIKLQIPGNPMEQSNVRKSIQFNPMELSRRPSLKSDLSKMMMSRQPPIRQKNPNLLDIPKDNTNNQNINNNQPNLSQNNAANNQQLSQQLLNMLANQGLFRSSFMIEDDQQLQMKSSQVQYQKSIINQDSLITIDEPMKLFEYYFKHNNQDEVMKRVYKQQDKLQKLRQELKDKKDKKKKLNKTEKIHKRQQGKQSTKIEEIQQSSNKKLNSKSTIIHNFHTTQIANNGIQSPLRSTSPNTTQKNNNLIRDKRRVSNFNKIEHKNLSRKQSTYSINSNQQVYPKVEINNNDINEKDELDSIQSPLSIKNDNLNSNQTTQTHRGLLQKQQGTRFFEP